MEKHFKIEKKLFKNKFHLHCTGLLYVNYLHVMKVRQKKITLVIADIGTGLFARLG